MVHHLRSTQRPNFQEKKPTKQQSKHKPRGKHQGKQWLVQRELYSLLPLGIETPKREEQESDN
jgi:hypothetical protein